MKKLRKIFMNPTAIAFSIVHWVVVVFSLSFENTQFFSDSITFDLAEPRVFNWLIYLNTPALFIMEFVVVPVLLLWEKNLLTTILGYLISVFLITCYWLLIGYLVSGLIKFFKSKDIKFLK